MLDFKPSIVFLILKFMYILFNPSIFCCFKNVEFRNVLLKYFDCCTNVFCCNGLNRYPFRNTKRRMNNSDRDISYSIHPVVVLFIILLFLIFEFNDFHHNFRSCTGFPCFLFNKSQFGFSFVNQFVLFVVKLVREPNPYSFNGF